MSKKKKKEVYAAEFRDFSSVPFQREQWPDQAIVVSECCQTTVKSDQGRRTAVCVSEHVKTGRRVKLKDASACVYNNQIKE